MSDVIQSTKQELRIALCEDNKEHLTGHHALLQAATNQMDTSFSLFETGEELIAAMKNGECFDVLFCDIELKEMDGIETGKLAKEINPELMIVFLTAYPQYAIRAYEAKAFRYLLKPFNAEAATAIMDSIYKEQKRYQKLVFKDWEKVHFVELSKVIYMEAQNKYTFAYTSDAEYSSQISLNEYEKLLKSYGFFRIHRKYLVNCYFIKELKSETLIMDNNSELRIARNQRASIKKMFYEAMERGIF